MAPRWILVEGWDGVGKTTLAKRLAKGLGYEYVHLSGLPRGEREVERCARTLLEHRGGLVLDRTWWTNAVYSALYPNRSKATMLPLEDALWLDLLAHDGALVHVDADPGTVERRLDDRPVNSEWERGVTASRGLETYREVLKLSRLPGRRCFKYWTYNSGATSFEGLVRALNHCEIHMLTRAVGDHINAKAWFIGERHLGNERAWFNSRSGRYLFRALALLDWQTNNVCTCNVYDLTHDDALMWCLEDAIARGAKIVAFGNTVSRYLNRLKMEHEQVAHPQFFNRFRPGQEKTYALTLAGASGLTLRKGKFWAPLDLSWQALTKGQAHGRSEA